DRQRRGRREPSAARRRARAAQRAAAHPALLGAHRDGTPRRGARRLPRRADPASGRPDAADRRHGHVTFGSFNNRAKLSPRTIAAWAEIMRRTPDARLLLKATQFKDARTRERCRDAFVAAGVAAERIEILPPL